MRLLKSRENLPRVDSLLLLLAYGVVELGVGGDLRQATVLPHLQL